MQWHPTCGGGLVVPLYFRLLAYRYLGMHNVRWFMFEGCGPVNGVLLFYFCLGPFL